MNERSCLQFGERPDAVHHQMVGIFVEGPLVLFHVRSHKRKGRGLPTVNEWEMDPDVKVRPVVIVREGFMKVCHAVWGARSMMIGEEVCAVHEGRRIFVRVEVGPVYGREHERKQIV